MFQHWHSGGKAGEAPKVKIMPWRDLIGLLRPGPIAGGDNASIVFFGSVGHIPPLARAHWRETNPLHRCAAHTLDKSTETNSGRGRAALWHSHLDSSEIVTTRIVFTTCQVRGDRAPQLCLRVHSRCESNANPMRNRCETLVRNPPRILNYGRVVLEGKKHK